MRSRRRSKRNFIKRRKRKLFLSEPVLSRAYQYYYGREQLKETYPNQYDDDYSYYHFPETRREYYNKDFGKESTNVPDYYRDNPLATVFVERYPKLRVSNKKKKKDESGIRRVNAHTGIERYTDSMDINLHNHILDELENKEELPDATHPGKRRTEFLRGNGGGFSRFGKYELGKDEIWEEEGLGRRSGKNRFGRSGRRNFRKRK